MTTRKPKNALVTGADGALGAAVCRRFLEAGCEVYGTYFGKTAPETPSDSPLTRVHWIGVDLSNAESVRSQLSLVEKAVALDAVVNCAGGFRFGKVEDYKDQDFQFLIESNLRSVFNVCRQTIPGMKERGFGRVINVSAAATRLATSGMGPYVAAKAGVSALTQALADEVKAFDINVNAVLPTTIDTPANRRDMPKADFGSWVPLDELASIIFELTQPWSRTIHGALIPVAGRV